MKKSLITIAVVALSLNAFAVGQENYGETAPISKTQYNPEAIYNALKVKEVAVNPGISGNSRFTKTVGNLQCSRTTIIYKKVILKYACAVSENKKPRFAALYKVLDVKEVAANPGFAGVSATEKSVGGLTCTKRLVIIPNAKPTFDCEFTAIEAGN